MQDGGQDSSWICFAGSGTVGVVAAKMQRDYVMIEQKKEYCEMAEKRLKAVETAVPITERAKGQLGLFERAKG